MSGIELKPIKDSGGTNILLPLGKTNLGRGSFLGVADKRVSRNHAVLEIEDGMVKIMPIHTNPTFVKRVGAAKLVPLHKDEWHELRNGDQISLTPEEHIFEIIVDERPIVQETQNPRLSLGDGSPGKLVSSAKQVVPAQTKQNNGVDDDQTENGQKAGDDVRIKDKPTEQSPATKVKAADEQEKESEEEEKKTVEDDEDQEEEDEESEEKDDEGVSVSTKGEDSVLDGDKELAVPVQKDRKLPAWMVKSQTETETPSKKATKQDQEDTGTPQKRGRGRPKTGSKGTPQTKRTPSRAKGRSKSYKEDDDDDYCDDDYASEEEPASKRSRTARSHRETTKVHSYAEDDFDDLDEEWVASEEDDDDASDWEMDSHSYSSKKGKGKGRPQRGKFVSPRKRGRRKKYTQSSDEDEDWSEEEMYVPRPSKRRALSSSNSKPTREARGSRRKPVQESDVSEEEEEEKEEEPEPKRAKRTTAKAETKEHEMSEEDEQKEVKKPANKKTDGKRKSCQFGKRCYRKNPEHFKDYCHPGDPDFRSLSDLEDNDDDDDRPECEYGTSCYRKHPEHIKQFKHTKSPDRSKLEAAKKGRKRGARDSDDDGAYDYNDSFLNDEDSGSDSPPDQASDDSDWGPEGSQDIRDLKKDAKDFIKNKKMQKT